MKNTLNLLGLFLVITLSFLACRGADGTDGKDGLNGTNGSTGPMGNANVIVSDWKSAKNIRDSVFDASNVSVGTVLAPELTAERMQKSAVLVYLDYGGGPYPLPFTTAPLGVTSTINYTFKTKVVKPYRFTHDNSNSVKLSSSIKYRYIIIPEGINRNATPINYDNYEEVKRYYNIKD